MNKENSMDTNSAYRTLTIDLNTNLTLHNISTSPVPGETLDEELVRMKEEKKNLVRKLTNLCEKYIVLQTHLIELLQKYSTPEDENLLLLSSRKRKKVEDDDVCCLNNSASPKRPREITTNVSTVSVKTNPSDQTSVVKDGYDWRKYGQKVTRDNPSPRAYYKCSFAPTCPVKKKVQRSIEDPSVLVAVYEGEHNHPYPSQAEVTLPLINQGSTTGKFMEDIDTNSLLQHLVEQMASSFTSNPTFTAAVAAAISGIFFECDLPFK